MKSDRKNIFWLLFVGFVLFLMIYQYKYAGEKLLTACRPLLIGLLIAYPLNIMINWFKRNDFLYQRRILKSRAIHNGISVVLAVLILSACAIMIIGYVVPQLTACVIALLDRVPSGIRYLLNQPVVFRLIPAETMETLQKIDWTNWINHLVSMVNSDDLFRGMTTTATNALSVFSEILFGILFAAYFLSGKDRAISVLNRMLRAFVPEKYQDNVLRDARLLNECFHDFMVCQATQALIIGVSAAILMNVFGFPYASMIGTMNGFCALIPVIGGYVGAILGTLMILADSPGMALFFLIFIVVLQNVIGTLVFPKLIGQSLGLPAPWTLAAVLIGSGLRGIFGITVGVPLTAFGYRRVAMTLKEREQKAEEARKLKTSSETERDEERSETESGTETV